MCIFTSVRKIVEYVYAFELKKGVVIEHLPGYSRLFVYSFFDTSVRRNTDVT